MSKKIIFIVEKQPIFLRAAEAAEANGAFGVYDSREFLAPDMAKEFMNKRKKMADGDEISFVIFGFGKTDFSDVVDRKGEPVIKYKGTITPNKQPKSPHGGGLTNE